MQLGRRPLLLALALTFALGIALGMPVKAPASVVMPPVVEGATVRTLAGDGKAGNADGPAQRAEFMFPVAVAYDARSGAIYVADTAGQRIRTIEADGNVVTVAGNGEPSATGLEVGGGFADGPAALARFNFPMALVLMPDGALLVADSMNHCIRKIAGGDVTTYAGVCGQAPGERDGPAPQATFTNPRGLALARDGTLFVADFSVGIRVIAPNGTVSTLPIAAQYARTISTLSLFEGSDGKRMLFAVGNAGFLRYNLKFDMLDGVRSAVELNRIDPFGMVAISDQAVILSSPLWHGLYFMNFAGTWRRIAGEGGQDAGLLGGYADGPPAAAKFYAPLGLALGRDGEVIVADAGNRRIRSVPAVDDRWTADYGVATPPKDPSVYHVFFVSNSFAFENVVWADSIEGIVERRLNAERGRIGLTKAVKIEVGYFTAVPLAAQADYIAQSLAEGTVDLVIWSLNPHFFHEDFTNWEVALPALTPANEAKWRGAVENAAAKLRAAHTKLVIVDEPLGIHLGPSEGFAYSDFLSYDIASREGYGEFGQFARTPGYGYEANVEIERFLSTLGVPFVPTYQRFVATERGPHRPLYSNYDFHFVPNGDAYLADILVKYLENARPWSAP